MPTTWSPTANFGSFEATTLPTPPARMTSPMPTGGMYDLPSFIQPRMAGSSDRYSTLTTTSPSAGSGTGAALTNSKSSRLTMPTGRLASLNWRLFMAFLGDRFGSGIQRGEREVRVLARLLELWKVSAVRNMTDFGLRQQLVQ